MAREDFLRWIPLAPLSAELLNRDLQISSKLIHVRGSTRTTARLVDYDALNILEHRLVDDGDLPPSWAYWWLTLAAELSCNASWSDYSALIVHTEPSDAQNPLGNWLKSGTSAYQVLPLMVEDMCDALRERALSAGFAVAWGVNGRDFNHPVLPISCRGAILPVVDGMGFLCIATDEDLNALHAWMGDEEMG